MSVVSPETMGHVKRVTTFFGIDFEENRHVFRAASNVSSDAFAVVMKAMAEAIEHDVRFGVMARIRQELAKKRGESK